MVAIGISNFREVITSKNPEQQGFLYVDKTMLIKDVIYDGNKVIVLTRPRRFGKTLNLSMLQNFFAKVVDGYETKDLFDNLEISKHPECMKEQGQYQVIFLTLKGVEKKTFEESIETMRGKISDLYKEHRFLLEKDVLLSGEKLVFESILKETSSIEKLATSIKDLSGYLKRYSGKEVYILIDEYDAPIQTAYIKGYYDDMISFMRSFLGNAIKTNSSLKKAILTGILRVSKESMFSGLNNVMVYSIINNDYSEYFGFTEKETDDLLDRAKLPIETHQLKEWYNGYIFGKTIIYNPWSILNFIKSRGELRPYWVNTTSFEVISDLIINSPVTTKEKLERLLLDETIECKIDENIAFADMKKDENAVWNLLLMSGYLKQVSSREDEYGCLYSIYNLKIPNKEVKTVLNRSIKKWLSDFCISSDYESLVASISEGDMETFERELKKVIENVVSCHDATILTQESFYHGLILGFALGLTKTHNIKSNRESGRGRYDICIIPKDKKNLGVVIELKSTYRENDDLLELSKGALEQIKKREYISELKSIGISNICIIGIAFYKKDLSLSYEEV